MKHPSSAGRDPDGSTEPVGTLVNMGEQLVGTVTHYFGQPHVAIVEVSDGVLRVGDTIRIAGSHSDFTQPIRSMELEHASVDSAQAGDTVGIQVSERAREHDRVYLLSDD